MSGHYSGPTTPCNCKNCISPPTMAMGPPQYPQQPQAKAHRTPYSRRRSPERMLRTTEMPPLTCCNNSNCPQSGHHQRSLSPSGGGGCCPENCPQDKRYFQELRKTWSEFARVCNCPNCRGMQHVRGSEPCGNIHKERYLDRLAESADRASYKHQGGEAMYEENYCAGEHSGNYRCPAVSGNEYEHYRDMPPCSPMGEEPPSMCCGNNNANHAHGSNCKCGTTSHEKHSCKHHAKKDKLMKYYY